MKEFLKGGVAKITKAFRDAWKRGAIPRAKRFLNQQEISAVSSNTLFANKKILKNMYNSIKNMEIPIRMKSNDRKAVKTERNLILTAIDTTIKSMNNIANKSSRFFWRLKKLLVQKREGTTWGEFITSNKRDGAKIASELLGSAKALQGCFENIKNCCTTNETTFKVLENSDLPKDKTHLYSMHSILESIKSLCASSIASFNQVFKGYSEKITEINYQNLLGTTDGKKYEKLENDVNEALKALNPKTS